jgi:uncharacterized membrane protein
MLRNDSQLPHGRFDAPDALRGVAMLWMTVFHFCFDLTYLGLSQANLYLDPFWTWQRTMIVSLFLLCAGLGQAIAVAQGQSWPRFWQRWRQVVGAAVLVSLGSWLMFPQTYIYFGVLHGMAVMLVIARLTATWGRWLWWLGGAAMLLPWLANVVFRGVGDAALAAAFNSPQLNWLGWITKKPVTEDYVPLFPWLGVMWWGLALGGWLVQRQPDLLSWAMTKRWQPLATLGRWSLSYYLLHQPVMLGVLLAGTWLFR